MANSKLKCTYCKDRFPREQMISTPKGKFCTINHATKYAIESIPKTKKKLEKIQRSEKFQEKQKRLKSSLPHQIELTRVSCNSFIRLMDAGKPCISCGRQKCGQRMEAGHYKSVGSHPELRFDPRNIYLQGSGCNQATSKRRRNNLTIAKEYEQRLGQVMGQKMVDWLNGPHPPKHYTCGDLVDLRAVFNEERRFIEENGVPSKDWRRLPIEVLNES